MREKPLPDPEQTGLKREASIGHDEDSDKWLTIDEVAEMLNVHPRTIRRWRKLGIIKTYRTGHRGKKMYSRDEIATFLP